METIETKNDGTTASKTGSTGRIVLGVLFLLLPLFYCVFQLLIPTINTFWMSLHKIKMLGSGSDFIGLENYTRLFSDESLQGVVGFTLIQLVIRLLAVAIAPPLLAWAAGQFGRPLRWGLRILLTLPVAFFVPVAIAITWGVSLNPSTGLFPFETPPLAKPDSARAMLLFIDALHLFGLVSGLGLIAYLPVWRRPAGAPPPTLKETFKPLLVMWSVGILATIVFTLSSFTLNFTLTGGGPLGRTSTLGILLYRSAFVYFQLGAAAAIASIILLVTLMLGVAAGLLVVLTRLRLSIVSTLPAPENVEGQTGPQRSKALPGIILAVLFLLVLGACLFGTLPFGWFIPQSFGRDGFGRLLDHILATQVFANTFIPPLITASLQVLIAYLAALSLGALQPFGRRSEWLLLLFSPWLFISVLPLSVDRFLAAQKAGLLNSSFGLISPILLNIPIIFILTIFFKGQASQLHRPDAETGITQTGDFFKHFILPSLPLAAMLWLVLLFVGWQDLFWPLVVNVRPEAFPLSVMLLQLRGMTTVTSSMLAAAVTLFVLPVCLLFFASLVPFQIFYLDRLTLYTDDPSSDSMADKKTDQEAADQTIEPPR